MNGKECGPAPRQLSSLCANYKSFTTFHQNRKLVTAATTQPNGTMQRWLLVGRQTRTAQQSFFH